jgi:hypothetical protein
MEDERRMNGKSKVKHRSDKELSKLKHAVFNPKKSIRTGKAIRNGQRICAGKINAVLVRSYGYICYR